MAKKQTRRSISVRGVTYNQLRDYCAGASLSMSDFVEQRIADFFAGVPVAAQPVQASAPRRIEAPRLVEKLAERSAPEKLIERRPIAAVAPSPARIEPVTQAAPRPLPATSTLVSRPMPVAARRAVSPLVPNGNPAPVAQMPDVPPTPIASAVGRPAPTPAASVLKERLTPPEPRDAKDYRAIRF